jgi:hypothetical protein
MSSEKTAPTASMARAHSPCPSAASSIASPVAAQCRNVLAWDHRRSSTAAYNERRRNGRHQQGEAAAYWLPPSLLRVTEGVLQSRAAAVTNRVALWLAGRLRSAAKQLRRPALSSATGPQRLP